MMTVAKGLSFLALAAWLVPATAPACAFARQPMPCCSKPCPGNQAPTGSKPCCKVQVDERPAPDPRRPEMVAVSAALPVLAVVFSSGPRRADFIPATPAASPSPPLALRV